MNSHLYESMTINQPLRRPNQPLRRENKPLRKGYQTKIQFPVNELQQVTIKHAVLHQHVFNNCRYSNLCSDQCAHSYRLSVRRLSKEPNTKRPIETVNLLEYLLRELYNSYEKEKN
jgi:hypothetical protein